MSTPQSRSPLIALFGLPNSGKSTLLNRLTSSKNAIVAREAHTTRDLNYGETEWDGMYLRFVDTGGLVPDPKDKIQKQIQIKSYLALQDADILIWVIDRKQNPDTIHDSIIKKVWSINKPVLIAINKVDDPNRSVGVEDYAKLGGFDFVNISATNSLGTDILLDSVVQKSLELGFSKQTRENTPVKDDELRTKRSKSKKLAKDEDGNFVILRDNSDKGPGMFFSASSENIINPIKNIVVDLGGVLFPPDSSTSVNQELLEFLESQKETGKQIFYLTNLSGQLLKKRVQAVPDLFDGGLSSIDPSMAKPNSEFFQEFLNIYNLQASQSVYFDDTFVHIESAQQLGFWSKQYLWGQTNPQEYLEQVQFGKATQSPEPPKIIMLGKPNVGKSSLFNQLIGKDVQIVTEIAGTTLSVNDYLLERQSTHTYIVKEREQEFEANVIQKYIILDSTGIRKPGQRTMGVESFATYRSIESAHRSDVICFVMDISQPITHQDQVVAGICQEAGKGIVLVLNKVDLVDNEQKSQFLKNFQHKFAFLKIDNIVYTSTTKGIGLDEFWDKVDAALTQRNKQIPKEDVRKLFNYLMKKKRPNKLRNKKRPVVYDLVYRGGNPPTFELLVKDKSSIHWSWIRFLENTIRRQFHFTASGLKLKVVEVDRKNILS